MSVMPKMAIFDATGTLAFLGHPASRKNIEADIDGLNKGIKIEGVLNDKPQFLMSEFQNLEDKVAKEAVLRFSKEA